MTPWPLTPWLQPSNSPFPMGVCQGNTCAQGQGTAGGVTWRGFQSLSRCPEQELGRGLGDLEWQDTGKGGIWVALGKESVSVGGPRGPSPSRPLGNCSSRDVTMEKNSELELGWKLRRAKDTRIPQSWVMDTF